MGIHRRAEAQFTPQSAPVPMPPKGGVLKETCDGVSELNYELSLTPNLSGKAFKFGGKQNDRELLNNLDVGSIISVSTYTSWEGRPVLPGDSPIYMQEESKPTTQKRERATTKDNPNEPRSVVDEKWKEKFSTELIEPERRLKKREEFEVKRIEKNPQGPNKVKVKIKAQNKKEVLLETKINGRVGEGVGNDTDTVAKVVEKIASDCGLSSARVETRNVPMPKMDINEMYAKGVLDICAKLANAGYTILENIIHFFTKGSRPHSVLATTRPNALAEMRKHGPSTEVLPLKPNPIRQKTLKVTKDATGIVDKVEVKNGGELSPRDEVFPGDGVRDEFHTSYQPEDTVVLKIWDGLV